MSGGPHLSARVREVIRAEKFDVVHVHSPLMPTLPLLALRSSDAVNVGTFHSAFDRSLLLALLRRRLQRYVDRLHAAVGVSDTALAGVRRYFRAPWQVIPNGVDVAAFSSGRRRPEFDDGRLNLLHVGRFDPRNGVDRVIRAWVAVRRLGTDARLILVGDGPLRPRYEAMVPADLRADAHFVGFVPGPERMSLLRLGRRAALPGGGRDLRDHRARGDGRRVRGRRGRHARLPPRHAGRRGGVSGRRGGRPGIAELARGANRLLVDEASRRRCAEAGRRTAARFDWPVVTGAGAGALRAAPRRRARAPLAGAGRMTARTRNALLLLAVCLGLRIVSLARPCLSDDEATYCVVAREMLHGRVLYRDVVDHKPPLIYLTYAATQALGGPEHGMLLLHLLTIAFVWATALLLGRIAAAGVAAGPRRRRPVRGGAALRRVHHDAARLRRAGGELRALHAASADGVGSALPARVRGAATGALVGAGVLVGVAVLYKYQAAVHLPLYACPPGPRPSTSGGPPLGGLGGAGRGFAAPLVCRSGPMRRAGALGAALFWFPFNSAYIRQGLTTVGGRGARAARRISYGILPALFIWVLGMRAAVPGWRRRARTRSGCSWLGGAR